MDKKTLVIIPKTDMYYFSHLRIENTDILPLKDKSTFIKKAFNKINEKLKILPQKCFYAKWYKNCNSYSKVVIFDAVLESKEIISDIVNCFDNINEKYIYFWNYIPNNKLYNIIKEYLDRFEVFDYDDSDCKNYNMRFNTIMYDKTYKFEPVDCEKDLFFLGFTKDKSARLAQIYDMAVEQGLIPDICVVGNADIDNPPFEVSHSYVSYKDYIKRLAKSRAILDLTQNGQTGFSMRVMESIFHDKKLVSDNEHLLTADFYDESRIYVLGHDKRTLKQFIETQMKPYSAQTKDYYSFEKWLSRFTKNS